jgi:hypothetical protein
MCDRFSWNELDEGSGATEEGLVGGERTCFISSGCDGKYVRWE